MSFTVGIDVGGTFTDVVVCDDDGGLRMYKTPTVPADITTGLLEGVKLAAGDQGLALPEFLEKVTYFGHGTTVATNALLERKGAKTGLITTKGFGDTILIARMATMTAGLPSEILTHYRLRRVPHHIVPPVLIREVTERIDSTGTVLVALNEDETRAAVRSLIALDVTAIAVCTLWSFLNPSHERRIKEIIQEEARLAFPAEGTRDEGGQTADVYVTVSSELVPVIKEYERTATTVLNAYLGPPVAGYMRALDGRFRDAGLRCLILIMNPVGGVLPAPEAAERAVALLNSGPAAGVAASVFTGHTLGYGNVITTDMGGTSFDAALIVDGEPALARETLAGAYHVLTPTIDVRSIGAGGGSIARVEDGVLKVGPTSAGAAPGPVCYERGGTEPTVTDADVVLGIINPDNFLGGRMKVNRERALAAIKDKLADPLGLDPIEAAAGVKRIVDNLMADLLREIVLEKGHDPRDFVIFAYGGAGATHCAGYGAELGARGIVVPSTSMAHSAFGCVASDVRYSFEVSQSMRTPAFFDRASNHLEASRLTTLFEMLRCRGDQALEGAGVPVDRRVFVHSVKMRYCRQTLEVKVPLPGGTLQPEDIDAAVLRFEEIYERLYGQGSAYREAGIEITTLCLDAVGRQPKPRLVESRANPANGAAAVVARRHVYFAADGGFRETAVYDSGLLESGYVISGPAVVEYPGTTLLVTPGQEASVDRFLNVTIETAR